MQPKLSMFSDSVSGYIGMKPGNWNCVAVLLLSFLSSVCQPASESTSTEIVVTGHGSDQPDPICQDFRLTAAQAQEFFEKAKPITGEELHNSYEYMPCWVEGKTTGAHGTSTWKIRPIGIAEVRRPDKSLQILGCKSCDNLFQ